MVTIILALCIPVTAFVTGYFALKGVQVGQKPSMPVETTPRFIDKEERLLHVPLDKVQTPAQSEPDKIQFAEMMNEWLNGESR